MRPLKTFAAVVIVTASTAWLVRSTVFAQHETAADLLDGERAYQATCANCHGPDGDVIAGIDFRRGQFRRPVTDEDLVRIIRTGIPNTPMPPSSMTEEQAAKIVAYLRSMPKTGRTAALVGDGARGKALFDGKGACTSCHRIGASGSRVGPDLTRIGEQRRAAELEQSLLAPDTAVTANNRSYRVVTRDGTTVTGRLLSHDTFSVQMIDTKEQLRSFVKADLREYGFIASPMPSYKSTFNAQELADVVSYLVSLKGRATP